MQPCSSSCRSKQSSKLQIITDLTTHSLSRKKQFLTLVTPTLREKPIKSIREIKNIALGAKRHAHVHNASAKVVSCIVVPRSQMEQEGFVSPRKNEVDGHNKSWMEHSARTRPCLEQSPSHVPEPETPINRLLTDHPQQMRRFAVPYRPPSPG